MDGGGCGGGGSRGSAGRDVVIRGMQGDLLNGVGKWAVKRREVFM
jgi:hypothetical protein